MIKPAFDGLKLWPWETSRTDDGGPAPLEVDRVKGGKGKDKGKKGKVKGRDFKGSNKGKHSKSVGGKPKGKGQGQRH